ncbi:hypothetical protein RRG08_026468 [Elysia crispata]|uniref:chitin synthase n=1 Tax=Elysia crispata TaxID=231223 RepID=A0AAE0Y474_9GAST|nr:hypothetical protein RRG08_026468 [Elysia crispata]
MESDEDLSRFRVLDETTVLRHLKRRYLADECYTFLGDVLVALNPNKSLDIYNKEHHERYGLDTTSGSLASQSPLSKRPHIFWIAQQSYLYLVQTKTNQCVLVSGESGTGKTESTKRFIDHVSFLCNSQRNTRLHEQITRVNPLLEAFGNAVTPLNSNSSRFGKLIELHVDNQSLLCGAKIQDYLLEKSRVVSQGHGERNFHIFYYLFAGLSREQKVYYNLGAARDYRILQHGRDPAFSKKIFRDMGRTFDELMDLMDTVGFSDTDVNNVLTILAAILHLTNIWFEESGDGADSVRVFDEDALASGASLLCVDMASLQEALISNTINVRGENVKQMKKLHQADDGRDALAKALYSRLFGWIVSHINDNLGEDGSSWENTQTLSILDFAGFERFQHNTLDQLCINVANEKLHWFFCHHIFSMEQRDLEAQGVKAELVEFKDNQNLIDLFFQKPQGVFYLLDEESSFPQSTDKSLVAKLNSACANNDHFLPVRSQAHGFTIVHYAGQVFYDARGMLERNRDRLGPHLENVILSSTNDMAKLLFTTQEHVTGSYSRSFSAIRTRPKLPQINNMKDGSDRFSMPGLLRNIVKEKEKSFVSRYFRKSLSELIGKLENSKPWFVRCVRPNDKSLPATFNDVLVTSQLRYNGLLEIAKIRRDGFPARLGFDDFLEKYKEICSRVDDSSTGGRWKVESLLKKLGIKGWALGHSMVFLQLSTQKKLDTKLELIRKMLVEEQKKKLQEEMRRKRAEETERLKETRIIEEQRATESAEIRQNIVPVQQGTQESKDNLQSPQTGHKKVKDWIDVLNEESTNGLHQANDSADSLISLQDPGEPREQKSEENSDLLGRGAWDRFQIVPRDNHPDHASLQTGMKLMKAVWYVITLLIVCCMALVSKLAFLTLTSGRIKGTRGGSSDPGPTLTLLCICFPHLCNVVIYTGRSLFGSSGWPSFRMIFVMLTLELSHTAGLGLLAFRVLPHVDMFRALIILTSVYSGPALMMTFSSIMSNLNSGSGLLFKTFIGITCFAIQVTSITLCCVQPFALTPAEQRDLRSVVGDPDYDEDIVTRPDPLTNHLLWELPLALVLVSISFWENFLEQDFRIFGCEVPLNAWKKTLHEVRQRLYIWLSLGKIIWSVLLAVVLVDGFNFSLSFPLQDDDDQSIDHLKRFGPLYACMIATVLCTYFAGLACKLNMQNFSFSIALCLVTPISAGLILLRCRTDLFPSVDGSYSWVCPESWSAGLSYHLALLSVTWISQCLLLHHIWLSDSERLAKIDKLFIQPTNCCVLTEQTLMLRRRTPINEKTLLKGLNESRFHTEDGSDIIPQVYACATMWHETRSEMVKLLKSIFRMDIDHSARSIAQKYYRIKDPDYYEYETHIFFDDAFDFSDDGEAVPNSFVLRFIECLDEAISSVHERPTSMQPPERTPTVYGGRLTWTLPGGTSLIVHLKDKRKIRNRKRWSQVMYLYYLLGYNILANGEVAPEHVPEETAHAAFGKKMKLTAAQLRKRRQSAFYSRTAIFNYVTEDIQRKSENTFILTLDGDVDFKPEAARLLVDRMKKNKKVGAACGRIHPIGTGPIVWYQQFEYAIGHWLQKATEHVFGCVLCAPGCFSLFRGSALMDDNVARMYATKSSEAGHYVQFDQGEDRWLSTLLLQQGYRIDYCAAADAYTQAPETFTEFFNQRRRWGPSTLANILDLLGDWRNVVHMNDNVSTLYIFYQIMMFVSTLLGPATVLLMMAGAYQVVFKITVFQSYLLSILPAVGYLLLCMLAKPSTQLSVAAVMSAVFAIVMTIVMVGTIGTAIEGSITSPNVLFMVMILVIFVTSGFLHPREIGDLVPGAIYFICIPAGYLILTIYFLTNLHVVSWGTRETPIRKSKEELEKEKQEREEKQRNKEQSRMGIFGWLGLRRLVEEFGEITRQFKDPLYSPSKKKKKSKAQNEPTPDNLSVSSMESTNNLLRELIEELRHRRHPVKSNKKRQSQEPSHKIRANLAGTGPLPLPGLIPPALSSDSECDDGNARVKQEQLGPDHPLEQVVVAPTPGISASSAASPDQERGWASWISHPALGEGPIKVVGDRERVFWAQVMAKYLQPIQEDSVEREKIHRDLLTLRNNVVFAFFMTTAVWIALFMQLEILQNELKDHMFVHIPRIDNQGYLSFQPLGLIFLSCFSIILIVQFLGMFLHRWGTFLHTLSITNLGIGSHQKEQEKVREIIIRVSELQKLRNIEMEPEPDYDERLPDYLDDDSQDNVGSSVSVDGGQPVEEPQPDYHDSEVNANRTPQVASRPLHAEDILSVPPSYHTDEEHRRGHHRLPMFDKQGYLGAFALENAFERRLRNTIQGRRPRVQRDGIASFSSRYRGVPTPFVSNYQTNDKRLSSYPEHRVHFYNEHQLERNEIPRAHGTSHLNRNSVRQEVNGVTRF